MTDGVDIANDTAEKTLTSIIQNRTKEKSLQPKGHCFYCNENIEKGSLFCDPDCRNDFDAEVEAKKRNGRI